MGKAQDAVQTLRLVHLAMTKAKAQPQASGQQTETFKTGEPETPCGSTEKQHGRFSFTEGR